MSTLRKKLLSAVAITGSLITAYSLGLQSSRAITPKSVSPTGESIVIAAEDPRSPMTAWGQLFEEVRYSVLDLFNSSFIQTMAAVLGGGVVGGMSVHRL